MRLYAYTVQSRFQKKGLDAMIVLDEYVIKNKNKTKQHGSV